MTDRPGGRKSRGQALAEFAMAAPLFFLIFLGVAEGGYFVVATTIVSHATHEGARYAILDSTGTLGEVRTRVQQRAAPVLSTASLPNSAITFRLTDTDGVSPDRSCNPCTDSQYQNRQSGDRLRVRAQYTHRPLVGYVFPGLTFDIDERAELLVEGAS